MKVDNDVKQKAAPPEMSKEKRVANLSLDENGTIEGDVSIEYTGHLGIERKLLNDDDSPVQREENLKEAVETRLSSAELTNIVIENVTDSAKPFIYKIPRASSKLCSAHRKATLLPAGILSQRY